MEPKELLKPRFEVIADYPFNPYNIGEIAESRDMGSIYQTSTEYTNEFGEKVRQANYQSPESFEKYPALFRKLLWYEKREESEMPKFLKHTLNGKTTYHKIKGWDMKNMLGWIDIKERSCCSLLTWAPNYTYQPVSEKEYNQHNKL